MKYIITCRHGESFKNLQDISGGLGAGLTETGVKQVEASAEKIAQMIQNSPNINVVMYRSSDRVQLVETAEIISNKIGVECQKSDKYVPIRLGVFDGMSGKKQRELYPTWAQEMQEWSDGVRDIMDVHVEGMQNPGEHVNGIISAINELPDETFVIMVGTRSDLSAVKNIVRGNHPWKKDTFRFYSTDYAELDGYTVDDKIKMWHANGITHSYNYNPTKEVNVNENI